MAVSGSVVSRLRSLRCQCATPADQAGVSPRVVQRLTGHASLDMTNRYTRPRMHGMEGAAAALPSLRPRPSGTETNHATGTDMQPISERLARHLPAGGNEFRRDLLDSDVNSESNRRLMMSRNHLGAGGLGRWWAGPVGYCRE
jgi:hypothetical protein